VSRAHRVTSTECGPAALPTTFSQITAVPGTSIIEFDAFGFLSGGNEVVAAGATCTAVVDVVAGPGGAAENSTAPSTVELNDSNTSRAGGVANDTLEVTMAAIHLTKEFTDDPVLPGDAATVRFTATNLDRNFDATDVAFTDDVGAALSGLVVVGPFPVDPCGAGSSLSGEGTGVLVLSGGVIATDSTCEFEVTAVIPDGSSSRSTSTTGAVSGAVDGLAVTGNVASDDLFVVLAPVLTAAFADDPQGAGGSVTLAFTVTNPDPNNAMTDIAFEDNLDPVLPSASVVAGTPAPPAPGGVDVNNVCGAGSNLSYVPRSPDRPTTLELTDGSLAAGDSCSFSVVLDVAASAASGGYPNTASSVGAVLLGADVTGNASTDELLVVGAPPLRTLFVDDAVVPGGTVPLLFTVVNGGVGENDFDSIGPIDDITFSDDLTFRSGLAAVAPLPAEPCGIGSSLTASGAGRLLTLTGGNLLEDEACTFAVTLQTTTSTPHGLFTNATSAVSATASGIPVTGPGDSDDVLVTGVTVAKEFTDERLGEVVGEADRLGDLAADTGATFTITVRVDGNTAGTISNTAIVSYESFDGGLSDNATIAETVVIAATDPPIRGTDGTDHAPTDRPSAYPIELADAGSAAALDAVVSDPLPAVVGTIEEAGVLTTLRSGATATPFAGPSLSLRVSVAAAPSSGVPSPRPNSPGGTLPVTGSNSSTPISLAALWMLAAGLGIFTLGRTKRRSRSA
jgi:LPXTG-motif cell wall-anchored protein